jgi:hypothetical protein
MQKLLKKPISVKPVETMEGMVCPLCNKGKFILHVVDFEVDSSTVVPGVWAESCETCKQICYSGESSRYIEDYLRWDNAVKNTHLEETMVDLRLHCFTGKSEFPEQTYQADSIIEAAAILHNCARQIAGIDRVTIEIKSKHSKGAIQGV